MATQKIVGRKNGVLANNDAKIIPVHEIEVPLTVVVRDSAISGTPHTIRLSIDGGQQYFTATYDYNASNEKGIVVTAPITHIEVVGDEGSEWFVL